MVISLDNELLTCLVGMIFILIIGIFIMFLFYLCCSVYNLSLKNDFLKHHIEKKKKEINK